MLEYNDIQYIRDVIKEALECDDIEDVREELQEALDMLEEVL